MTPAPHAVQGGGALLTGDVLQVARDLWHVGFMRSFPHYIPLSADCVRRIVAIVEPLRFDRLYGAWFGLVIDGDANAAVARSAQRYVAALEGAYDAR